jgi:hypothetical protein
MVDACWGAGYLTDGVFIKYFQPHWFSMTSSDFNLSHHSEMEQFRDRGPDPPLSCAEFKKGLHPGETRPLWYPSGYEENLSKNSLQPSLRDITLSHRPPQSLYFGVSWVCDHFDPRVQGGALPLALTIGPERIALDYDGMWWGTHVPTEILVRNRGEQVALLAMTKLDGEDARGAARSSVNSAPNSAPHSALNGSWKYRSWVGLTIAEWNIA